MTKEEKKKAVDILIGHMKDAIYEGVDLNKDGDLTPIELIAATASAFYQFAIFQTMVEETKKAATQMGKPDEDFDNTISDEMLAKIMQFSKKPGGSTPLSN